MKKYLFILLSLLFVINVSAANSPSQKGQIISATSKDSEIVKWVTPALDTQAAKNLEDAENVYELIKKVNNNNLSSESALEELKNVQEVKNLLGLKKVNLIPMSEGYFTDLKVLNNSNEELHKEATIKFANPIIASNKVKVYALHYSVVNNSWETIKATNYDYEEHTCEFNFKTTSPVAFYYEIEEEYNTKPIVVENNNPASSDTSEKPVVKTSAGENINYMLVSLLTGVGIAGVTLFIAKKKLSKI